MPTPDFAVSARRGAAWQCGRDCPSDGRAGGVGWCRHPARRGARIALAAVTTLLAACAALPLPPLPDAVPAHWQQANAAPAPDLRSWWRTFHDPVLDALVERALAGNPSLAQAVARVEAARSLLGASDLGHAPQIGFHTYAEPTPDSSASYFQFGFDAKWEFGWFGRGESEQRIAAGDLQTADAEAQAARVSVVAEVVRTYLELRGAQQRLALLEASAADATRRHDLIATRLRLRLAAPAELARARVQVAQAQAALAEPRAALARGRQQLAVLLGQFELEPSLLPPGNLPQLGEAGIAGVPADLLRTRPEIRRAEAQVLKTAGELGLARADRLPRLGLGGGLTYAARVIGHTRLSDAAGIVTFGPAIDIPLFDWGLRQQVVDAREAQLTASLQAYRQAVLDGVAEAETALATLEQQRQREQALGQAVAALAGETEAAATRRRLGLADEVERLDAAAALVQGRLEALAAQQDRGIAFVALYKALGGAPLPVEATP
ncbi:MAG: efflux transporter outer membrane subunit [Dokdonella sp.]|uniref:efflux transporter outer membrane subunit n=1 Tax=Dokdonella sp. TaxID=2291710 RepID=UPI0025BBD227|nr:efflux transporter outer membrane subunit [Dokdonella sp.]MBX3701811.1 efflux transporter outer membrane subunit [Dokdonella sp.]MCW5578726.1 efflux transporter outer membrane subunit [Dokdonella sp.]